MKTQLNASLGSTWLAIGILLAGTLVTQAGEPARRISTIRPPLSGRVIKAQLGSDGTIHLLLQDADGPQYARSKDNGITFSSPIRIVDASAQKPGLEFHAEDLAIGKEGRVLVAMSNNAWKLKLPQEEWGFFYASLNPEAKSFTPTRNLNLKPSEGFSLAADQHGNVTAWFLSGKLFAKMSGDNGQNFTPNAEPNPAWNPCDCCTTSATYGPDGKLAALYREETDNERDMYVILWDRKNGNQPIRKRVSGTSWKLDGCPMTYFSITGTAAGYVAAWPTKGQVYFARLDKTGAVLPPGEIRTPGSNGMRTGILALSAATDGATVVAWKKDDLLGWQLYDAKGQPQGEPESAKSAGNGAAGVALPTGNFILFL
ncbi:MAG: hypothetical protein L0Z50_32385 [Verrucomicrobiales bacterium]|nr:hypothetical protein [Verrucomicrobiales bacterium]